MRNPREHPASPHGRGIFQLAPVLALLGLALAARPCAASSYYEMTGPHRLGTGEKRVADPVDLAAGAFMIDEPLAFIPGRVPIALDWLFTSQSATAGPLGTGTSLSTDYMLAASVVVPGDVELCGPGDLHFLFQNNQGVPTPGNHLNFADTTDPEVLGAQITFANAQPNSDLTAKLRWKDGSQFFFDSGGFLYQIQDRLANSLTIYRNAKHFPTEIRQPSGRAVTLAYNSTTNELASVTLPLDRTWLFSYDNSSPPRLTRVTDPTGAHMDYTWTSYTRSDGVALPLVQTCADRLGNVKVVNSYDGQGRVVAQRYPDGGFETLAYSSSIGQNGYTTVTDPNKNPVQWQYTWNPVLFGYNITSATDQALNETTTYARANPASNLVTSITNYLGQVSSFGWDFATGNLLSLTVPTTTAANALTTAGWSFQYDSTFNQLAGVTDPLGRQTVYTIDPATGNTTSIRDPQGFTTTQVFAKNGDLMSVTDALGYQTRFRYTADGDLDDATDPLNNETVYFFDDASRPIGMRDANGKQIHIEYTLLDDLASITRYLAGVPVVTRYQYDSEQNLRFLTDPLGRVREWRYDSKNRPVQEIDPLGQSTLAFWDQNDNLVKWQDRKGQTGQYIYGTNGAQGTGDRLTQALFTAANGSAPESSYTVTYDPTTHLVSQVADSQAGTFGYKYDLAFRLIEEDWTEPGYSQRSVAQTLDQIGRRTSMTATGQDAVTYGFDLRDDVVSITQDALTTNLQFDGLGRLVKRTLPMANGVSTAWIYNGAGFLTNLISTHNGDVIDSHAYLVDHVGNITQDANSVTGLTWNYTDDDLYRLTQATLGTSTYSWVYDPAGNRLSQNAAGATTAYGFDANNRMVSVNGAPVSYDANGNMTAYGTEALTWDVRNRLVGLTAPGTAASFVYDYTNRRTSKTFNGTHTSLLNDGEDLVSEITNGTAVNTLQSPFVDEPIARGGLYFTPNHLGSITTLTDGSGNLAEQYFYLPFGQTGQSAGTTNPFQFTGRENDGTGLYFYRNRYYSPDLGRFLSEDPIGTESGDSNLYAYVGDDPINGLDPLGLDWLDSTADFSAGVGDSLTFGGTDLVRRLIGANGVVNQSSFAYQAGGYTELAAEIALSAGSAGLKAAASHVTESAVRSDARRAIGAELRQFAKANGLQIHHINPLAGHPGGARTLFPLRGLPAWVHSGRWNLKLLSKAEHLAAHRDLRLLEGVVTLVVNRYTIGGRAGRLLSLYVVTATNPPEPRPGPTLP